MFLAKKYIFLFAHFKKYVYLCRRFRKNRSVTVLFRANRDVAQLVSVHVWGACGRQFESDHPDKKTPFLLSGKGVFYVLFCLINLSQESPLRSYRDNSSRHLLR